MAYSRPSSSGGRLEQHLGAVESSSVVPPSPSTLGLARSVPAPQGVMYPVSGSRIGPTAVAAAGGSSLMGPKSGVASGQGGGDTRSLGAPGDSNDSTRAFKGGTGAGGSNASAGFGPSASRMILGEQQAAAILSEATHQQHAAMGRKPRDRGAGGGSNRRRAPTDPVTSTGSGQATTGADVGAKGGAGRGKIDARRTRARRAVSQVSFSSSSAVEGGGGSGGGGGDDRGGEFGGRVGVRRGRRPNENDTEDNKFRMQAGQSNTLVAVRLRPLLKHDREHVEVAKVRKHVLG